MRLIDLQRGFLRTVSSPGDADYADWPQPLHAGLAVYRNAYRARLIGCLQETFAKCRAWAGDEAFDAAASHHCIRHPPQSWTLDALGTGFDETLAELFPDNPELAELGWLEWQMATRFTAPDGPRLDAAGFAELTANFTETDWEGLRLAIAPELIARAVAHDVPALWTAITTNLSPAGDACQPAGADARVPAIGTLAVWRVNHDPRFRLLDNAEAAALDRAAQGMPFGEICRLQTASSGAETAVRCGEWLGRWVVGGMVAGFR